MRENHSVEVEPEPVSVQVVERVGLAASSFQFYTRLATVFAEEVLDFEVRRWPNLAVSILLLDLTEFSHSHPLLWR